MKSHEQLTSFLENESSCTVTTLNVIQATKKKEKRMSPRLLCFCIITLLVPPVPAVADQDCSSAKKLAKRGEITRDEARAICKSDRAQLPNEDQQRLPHPTPSAWLGVPAPFVESDTVTKVTSCGNYDGAEDNYYVVTVTQSEGCDITGSYVAVDASDIAGRLTLTGDHLMVMNSRIHDAGGVGAMVAIGNGSTDIIIIDNEIDHNGPIPSKKDSHGVSMGRNTNRVWILDNDIHTNSGDAIQFCHNCINNGNGPGAVYISGNILHDDEENAIDLKEYNGPVIITSNEIYGYKPGQFSGHGEAIRLNDEGRQGEVWIVNNVFHDNTYDINPSRSKGTSYILDNTTPGGIGSGADVVKSGSGAERYYVLYEEQYGLSIRPERND